VNPETLRGIVEQARRYNPDALFSLLVVGQRWPGIQFGQRVRFTGRLTGRFIMDVKDGSLLDLYLSDIEEWLAQQERRGG